MAKRKTRYSSAWLSCYYSDWDTRCLFSFYVSVGRQESCEDGEKSQSVGSQGRCSSGRRRRTTPKEGGAREWLSGEGAERNGQRTAEAPGQSTQASEGKGIKCLWVGVTLDSGRGLCAVGVVLMSNISSVLCIFQSLSTSEDVKKVQLFSHLHQYERKVAPARTLG